MSSGSSNIDPAPDPIAEGIWDLTEIEETVSKPAQWGSVGARTFAAFPVSHLKLPPGCYSVTKNLNTDQIMFIGKYIKSDKILRFADSVSSAMLKEIDEFWGRGQLFIDHGFLHRRGYILYGPQGTGKSSIVWQVAEDVIKRGGVVLVCDNTRFFAEGLRLFRQVEPNRPIVCVFEDIDAIIKKYGDTEILSILDGDSQIDKVINIATTNYPESLDPRIVNRPRRFDRLLKIVAPDASVRSQFLKTKLPKKEKVADWVKKTDGLSFAAMAECIISVFCLGNDLDDTIKILRELESHNPQSSDFGAALGFGARRDGPSDSASTTP